MKHSIHEEGAPERRRFLRAGAGGFAALATLSFDRRADAARGDPMHMLCSGPAGSIPDLVARGSAVQHSRSACRRRQPARRCRADQCQRLESRPGGWIEAAAGARRHRHGITDAKIKRRMEQIEQCIERYLAAMDTADRTQSEVAEPKAVRLKDKIEKLKQQMQGLKEMEQRLREAPDGQVSLTDPDARSMATSGRGTGVVGYNVQTAVDDKHHLIVAHEVTNVGNDRTQLASMAQQAREATGIENLSGPDCERPSFAFQE
jgi:hypothetical protein